MMQLSCPHLPLVLYQAYEFLHAPFGQWWYHINTLV